MDRQWALESLGRFPGILKCTVSGLSSEQALFRESENDWSVLEIVCHLVDEEYRDFPKRIRQNLAGEKWDPIDPEGWAVDENYRSRNLQDQVDRFTSARTASLKWLESEIDSADWLASYQHPTIGELRAGDLLHSWIAHDLLHLRQITKRLFEYNQRTAGSFETGYAGKW